MSLPFLVDAPDGHDADHGHGTRVANEEQSDEGIGDTLVSAVGDGPGGYVYLAIAYACGRLASAETRVDRNDQSADAAYRDFLH